MIFNAEGLQFPENIYRDAELFHAENQARCYYYHKVSTEKPDNSEETVNYLIENFFSRREKLTALINSVYRNGIPLEAAAEKQDISSEEAEETLKQFYRDLLYFPRYNEILSKGIK